MSGLKQAACFTHVQMDSVLIGYILFPLAARKFIAYLSFLMVCNLFADFTWAPSDLNYSVSIFITFLHYFVK